MTKSVVALLFVAILLGARTASTLPPSDLDVGTWLVASDILPFSFASAHVSAGGGVNSRFLGDRPEDLFAGGSYRDRVRGVLIELSVTRNGNTAYLDHLIEADLRDDATGRMLGPENAMVLILGNPVFIFCDTPPDCEGRQYLWRSGPNFVVKVRASAAADVGPPDGPPKIRRLPCPEPTELLQTYLQRYPSSLTLFADSDDRAKAWRRDQTALELAAADYQLDRAATLAPDNQWQALGAARDHLALFAQLRELALRGPSFIKERDRIGSTSSLPTPAQLTELNKIRQEYRQWWNAHLNDPVFLPPP